LTFSYIRNVAPESNHYFGWGYIINKLKSEIVLDENGIVLDTWVDRFDRDQFNLLSNNPWIGIAHFPPSPARSQNLDRLLESDMFRKTQQNCKLLLATSDHSTKYIQSKTKVPTQTLLHPKPDTGHYFDLDFYLAQPILRHSGFFGRNIEKFISFNSNIQKVIYCDRPHRAKIYLNSLKNNQSIIFHDGYLQAEDYINIFTRSIGFSFYDDCSASTAILEHIMTHTPVLVNRIPPIVEYLGEDYPMYLDDLSENADKLLMDRIFLQEVSDYLSTRSKKKELSVNYFIDFFKKL